jgi:hypothetical protein
LWIRPMTGARSRREASNPRTARAAPQKIKAQLAESLRL